MESNIKGLVSAGHEMASELKAECGAVDMRSVAKLLSDLATQLEVQLVRANALAEDQQKAIESIKQADSAVKLAHEKFSALAAENAGLKHAMAVTLEHVSVTDAGQAGVAAMIINDALHHSETPASNVVLPAEEAEELARIALASLEAEPVSQTYKLNELSGNPPVTPDGWISCSELMPNDAQWCVVNTEYGYYVQCWSEGQGWLGDDISIPECDVINWMPLPEPPQEAK